MNTSVPQSRPWLPRALVRERADTTTLTYLVVEDLVSGIAGLSLSPWPTVDPRGRLHFPIARGLEHVGVDAKALLRFLAKHRRVPGRPAGRRRPLRVGDVFAATVKQHAETWDEPLDRYLQPPVYDLTVEGREVAKLAYYGAVADIWDARQAGAYRLTESQDDPTTGGGGRPR